MQIAGWNAPQTDSINQNAPFLFSVNPTTLDTTGFYDSWDYPGDNGQGPGQRTLWGSNNGGTGVFTDPPDGATSALLLDADYHITPIYQVLTGLTPGNEYHLSFDWDAAQWHQNYGPTTEGIEIGLGGTIVQVEGVDKATGYNGLSLPAATNTGWMSFSADFFYTGKPTNMTYGFDYGGESFTAAANWLTFIAEGSPQGMPPTVLLSDVSLTDTSGQPPYHNPGIPEPATWVTMLLGLGGLGVLARRRRALAARAA